MKITQNEISKASEIVEKIMKLSEGSDIKKSIKQEVDTAEISQENQREFYTWMKSLFLNIVLNRLKEFGENAKERSFEARTKINELIDELK
jgi:hypothetical protein